MITRTYAIAILLVLALELAGCSKATSREFKRDVNQVAREVDDAFEK